MCTYFPRFEKFLQAKYYFGLYNTASKNYRTVLSLYTETYEIIDTEKKLTLRHHQSPYTSTIHQFFKYRYKFFESETDKTISAIDRKRMNYTG